MATVTTRFGLRKPVDADTFDAVADIAGNMQIIDDNAALKTEVVSKAGDTMTGPLVLSGDPVNPLDAVTKRYSDASKAGLTWKDPTRVATTANIALTGLQTIDGVVLVAGDRVLVWNQATGSQNGIYTAAAGAWTRATDADANVEVKAGMYVPVTEGTTYADSAFVLATNDPITVGTTALTFKYYASLQELVAGAGLSKVGTTVSVNFPSTGGTNGTTSLAARSDHTHTPAGIGAAPATHSHTFRLTHTYDISGDIKVASGTTDYILPFNMPTFPAGQTVTLKGIICYLESGTSATIKVARKPWGGAEADLAAPYAAIIVTPTEQEVTGDVSLAAKDRLRPIVTLISGTPRHITIGYIVEYTHQ